MSEESRIVDVRAYVVLCACACVRRKVDEDECAGTIEHVAMRTHYTHARVSEGFVGYLSWRCVVLEWIQSSRACAFDR